MEFKEIWVFSKKLKQETKQLELLQRNEGPETWDAIKNLIAEIDIMLEREDIRWKQRAEQNWYQHRDRNTSFFHAWANHQKKINTIKQIVDEEGVTWKKKKEIGKAFVQYYSSLFTAGDSSGTYDCLEDLEVRVIEGMNGELLRPFTTEEVEAAINHMHPLKLPGPDGFSACFYHNSWSTVKVEVCNAVLDYLNNNVFDENIKATNIALIPKVSSPTKITDYRPISLCNVIYKIIAKVLANRMKKVLPHIISPTQSTFIPGRLITDNILMAFEALHTMDGRLKGREGFMALKLDMSKTYDRVE
jgi:hypothetical protein